MQLEIVPFLSLLETLFSKILSILQRVSFIHELVMTVLNQKEDQTTFNIDIQLNENYYTQVTNDSQDLLQSATELAHVQCSKLLKTRAEMNNKALVLSEFVKYHEDISKFIQDSEKITRKQCYGLRPTLSSQVFLSSFSIITPL